MISLFFLGWAGLYALLPLEPAGAPPAQPLYSDAELYLPDSTLAVLSVVDAASLAHHLRGTQIWQRVEASSFQPDLKQLVEARLAEDEALALYQGVRQVLTGPTTLALLDLDVEAIEADLPPRVAFFSGLAPDGERRLLELLPRLFSASASLRIEAVPDAALPYMRAVEADGGKLAAAFVIRAGRLLVVTHESDLVPLSSPAARPLARHSSYVERRSEQKHADIAAFVDLARLGQRLLPAIRKKGPSGERLWDALGMPALQSAWYTATPAAEGYVERFGIAVAPGASGLLPGLVDRLSEVSVRAIGHAPPGTTLLLDFHATPAELLYRDLGSLLAQTDPEALAQMHESLAEAGTELGLDVERDLIAQLSGELALALKLPSVSAIVVDNPIAALGYLSDAHLSLHAGVKDEVRAGAVVRQLLDKAGATVTDEPHRGVVVGYISSSAPLPVIPTFTVHDGLLGFHLNAGSARAAIDARLDGRSLLQDPDYRHVSRGADARGASSVAYLRLAELVPLVLRLSRRALERESGGSDPDARRRLLEILAAAETLGARLHGLHAQARAEKGVLRRESYTPMSPGTGFGLLSGAGMVLAVALPVFFAADERSLIPSQEAPPSVATDP
jgi:hypothetical protein